MQSLVHNSGAIQLVSWKSCRVLIDRRSSMFSVKQKAQEQAEKQNTFIVLEQRKALPELPNRLLQKQT